MAAIVACALLDAGLLLVKADGPMSGFLLALLAWSAMPYAACLWLARSAGSWAPAAAGLAAAVAIDLWTGWSVFVRPSSSTSALALLFAPFWQLLAIAVAAGVAYAVARATSASRR